MTQLTNKSVYCLLATLLLLIALQGPSRWLTAQHNTNHSATVTAASLYECIDNDGDDKCDNPPED